MVNLDHLNALIIELTSFRDSMSHRSYPDLHRQLSQSIYSLLDVREMLLDNKISSLPHGSPV